MGDHMRTEDALDNGGIQDRKETTIQKRYDLDPKKASLTSNTVPPIARCIAHAVNL